MYHFRTFFNLPGHPKPDYMHQQMIDSITGDGKMFDEPKKVNFKETDEEISTVDLTTARDRDIEMIKNSTLSFNTKKYTMKEQEDISDTAFDEFISMMYPRKRIRIPTDGDYNLKPKIINRTESVPLLQEKDISPEIDVLTPFFGRW